MHNPQFENILWPTDFSDFSFRATDYVISLCQKYQAHLHILTIIPPPTDFIGLGSHFMLSVQKMMNQIKSEAKDKIHEIIKTSIPDTIQVSPCVLDDLHPWEGILQYAKTEKIDLIVLTTHGDTKLKHAIFGSTTDRVIRHTYCPVLTIRPHEMIEKHKYLDMD